MLLAKGTVLGKRWEVQEVVGEGACGKVYAVKSSTGATFDFPLVAKVIPTSVGTGKAAVEQKRLCDTLNYENTLFIGNLCEFSFRPCIPDIRTFHGVDAEHGVRYLVMERFERDLVGFASHSKPTNQSVANIGLQLLEGLHWMHKKGLLFIDVKPDNFMLNGDRIKFVDYGLVERWVSAMGTGERMFVKNNISFHFSTILTPSSFVAPRLKFLLSFVCVLKHFTIFCKMQIMRLQ